MIFVLITFCSTSPACHVFRYVCSLYWALSVMTNLKGPPAHETRQCLWHDPLESFVVNPLSERVYTILVFILGCVLFSCIYGNINQFITNLYASGLRYRKRMEELEEFAKFHRLSPQLRIKIRNYVDFQWSVTKGINVDTIASGLPAHLQVEMRLQLNKRLVEQVSIFVGCPREFFEALVSKLQPCICIAGDFVFYEGEIGSRMYFVKRGVAQVGKGATILATFNEGDYFGEVALLTDQPRTASVIAVTDLMLLSLSSADLDEVLAMFPAARMRIELAAQERVRALSKNDNVKSKFPIQNYPAGMTRRSSWSGRMMDTLLSSSPKPQHSQRECHGSDASVQSGSSLANTDSSSILRNPRGLRMSHRLLASDLKIHRVVPEDPLNNAQDHMSSTETPSSSQSPSSVVSKPSSSYRRPSLESRTTSIAKQAQRASAGKSAPKPSAARSSRRFSIESGLSHEHTANRSTGVFLPGVPNPVPVEWMTLGASGRSSGRCSSSSRKPSLEEGLCQSRRHLSISSDDHHDQVNDRQQRRRTQNDESPLASARSGPLASQSPPSADSNRASPTARAESPSELTRPSLGVSTSRNGSLVLCTTMADPHCEKYTGTDLLGCQTDRQRQPMSQGSVVEQNLRAESPRRSGECNLLIDASSKRDCEASASPTASPDPSFRSDPVFSRRRGSVGGLSPVVIKSVAARVAESLSFKASRTQSHGRVGKSARSSEHGGTTSSSESCRTVADQQLIARLHEAMAAMQKQLSEVQTQQGETIQRLDYLRGDVNNVIRRLNRVDEKWM